MLFRSRLSRQLADKRIFPAVDISASGTRREEMLLGGDEVAVTWRLRRALAGHDPQQSLEIVLDRKLMEKRIFPTLDINKSGTRKEELLLSQADLIRITALRQVLHPFTPIDAMEFVLKHMRPTASNAEFLGSMNR